MKQRQRNGGLSANPDLGEMCPGPPPADLAVKVGLGPSRPAGHS